MISASRGAAAPGVVVFKVGDGERVVSVARLPEESDENGNGGNEFDDAAPADEPGADETEENLT